MPAKKEKKMTEFLEATMLICFGLSWPIKLVNDIKAKSASSINIKFIVLIFLGYVAGILAKIISGNITYVLIVYLINILIVTANIYVYFRNKKYDGENSAISFESDCKYPSHSINECPFTIHDTSPDSEPMDFYNAMTRY